MVLSWLLFQQIAKLFLMILAGFILTRRGLLKREDARGISVILMYLVNPSVIFRAFETSAAKERLPGFFFSIAAALAVHAVLFLLEPLMKRRLGMDRVERAGVIYMNCGNMIVPIVNELFGREWLVYSIAFMAVQNLFIWTHLISSLSGERTIRLKKVVTNPNIIAVFAGIGCMLASFHVAPVIGEAMDSMGGMIGPASMLVAGVLMGSADLKAIFGRPRLLLTAALRLIVTPLILLPGFCLARRFFPSAEGGTLLTILYIVTLAPTATTVVTLAQVCDCDAEYASSVNILTTLACIVTMPAMIALYQFLAG